MNRTLDPVNNLLNVSSVFDPQQVGSGLQHCNAKLVITDNIQNWRPILCLTLSFREYSTKVSSQVQENIFKEQFGRFSELQRHTEEEKY